MPSDTISTSLRTIASKRWSILRKKITHQPWKHCGKKSRITRTMGTHNCCDMSSKKEKYSFIYGLVVAILLLCLFDMPYGFYTFVRFTAAAAFCYFAYQAYERGNKGRMFLFIVLAILFQPFVKIPLGRAIWNIVDVVVAAYLICLLFKSINKRR